MMGSPQTGPPNTQTFEPLKLSIDRQNFQDK